MTRTPSWNDLRRGPSVEPDPRQEEFDDICAAALATPAGRRLLEALHDRYLANVMAELPDDRALLANHSKRHFVRMLEIATARGLERRKVKAQRKT
jgi:hypothetical protein